MSDESFIREIQAVIKSEIATVKMELKQDISDLKLHLLESRTKCKTECNGNIDKLRVSMFKIVLVAVASGIFGGSWKLLLGLF